ncbi:MAG: ABC transporter substrate-binding protein [Syntrophomonadaceae bacterium]|nr:ABC transporter substrate-binding protein [Syntrophomonadaceae bacterium]MDD3022729.1 ABC transporter substrate-binding protein [Syntrophomonadaceae bacterium]
MIKRGKRIAAILTIIMLISILLTGCGGQKKAAVQQQTTPPAEKTITDHAGRSVTIPGKIEKVYFTSPAGMIMVYTLAPEKMAGISMKISEKEQKYLLPEVCKLPYIGGIQLNAKINNEELLKADPDVIFSVGPEALSEKEISTADKLQKQVNIPVIILDGNLESTEKTLAFLGEMLGVEDRAQKLIAYSKQTLKQVSELSKTIPEDKKVKVYYAEGPKGLATEPKSSSHALLFNMVNAQNVAEVAIKGTGGMSNVSLEQVLKWNPDVIFSWGTERGGAYDQILASPDWNKISAVKNKKVYEIPNAPFNWIDRPPSISRLLGLKWLGATLYPDVFKYDMIKEVKDFYKLFYHVELTDQDAKDLLKNSLQ